MLQARPPKIGESVLYGTHGAIITAIDDDDGMSCDLAVLPVGSQPFRVSSASFGDAPGQWRHVDPIVKS